MTEKRMMSVDLGKHASIALWKDLKCYEIVSYDFNPKLYMINNLMAVLILFQKYVGESNMVSVEKPSIRMPQQWIMYYDLRELASECKCEFGAYVPMSIKKEVTGSGKATKDDVAIAVIDSGYLKEGLLPQDEHQFDSVAIGLCHLYKTGVILHK